MTDNSLLQDFIVETGEHLEDTERNLLRLEQQPDDATLLNDIFRSIHTIKGSSEYLGLERIAELSHKLENLLDLLRRKERTLDSNVIDLLITTNDRIATLVDNLADSQEEHASIDDLVSRIDVLTGHAKPVSAEEAIAETEPQSGDEIEDEVDEELFGIFVDQLTDGLQALLKETQVALNGEADEALLIRYEDRLGILRSSANYMGYEKLKQVYVQWTQSLATIQKKLKSGEGVDWNVFAREINSNNIDRVKSFFPRVSQVQQIDTAVAVPEKTESTQEQISAEPEGTSEELRFDDIGIDIESGLEASDTGPGIESSPELALFSDSEESIARMPERTDNTLLHEFIIETGEHLEDTERNLLRLEQQPKDVNLLNDIFRSIHTIKGSSEYLGLERVAELSHKLENLLDLLRRGEREVTADVVELLINTNDRVAQLVDDLAKSREEKATIDDLVARIDGFSEKVEPVSVETVTDEPKAQEVIDEIDDEYDQELFGIFVEQLKDGLQALIEETRKLKVGGEDIGRKPLAIYEERLNTLKASANYMGYDSLKQVYGLWAQSVSDTVRKVDDGQTIDWVQFSSEVTFAYLQRVASFFPKLSDVQQLLDTGKEEEAAPPAVAPEATETEATEATTQDDAFALDMDQGLLGDFIAETGEHLEEIEHNLLLLKKDPEKQETLNELFRSVHTIKGSSEYLGMLRVAELSHKLEGLLDLLRRQERVVNDDIIDILMNGGDRIAELVEDLATQGAEKADIADLTVRIDALIEEPQEEAVAEDEQLSVEPALESFSPKAARDFDEMYDKELFDIYMEQFNAGINALESAAKEITASQDPTDILSECEERIRRLRSSANYMEYDDLKAIYDKLGNEIEALVGRLKDGQTVDLAQWSQDVMLSSIHSAMQFFEAPAVVSEAEDVSPPSDESVVDEVIAVEAPEAEATAPEAPVDTEDVIEEPAEIEMPAEQPVEVKIPAEEPVEIVDSPEESLSIEEIVEDAAPAGEPAEEVVDAIDEQDQDILEQFTMASDVVEEEVATSAAAEPAPLSLEELVNMPLEQVTDLTALSELQGDDDRSLLDRLESAFDANIGIVPATDDQDDEDQTDLVRELLSGEEEAPPPPYFVDPEEVVPTRRPVSQSKDIESLLFSDSASEATPRQTNLPKPLARPTKKAFQRATGALEEEDRRGQYNLGRRQSDKFRERLIKQSIRVDAAKIDTLMNQVGELVVTRAGFSQLFLEMRDLQLSLKQSQRLDTKEMALVKELTNRINEATVSLGRVTSELQENVMKVRMLPIAQLFSRYPRVVHDLVRNSEKQVDLTIFGEETELDRMVIEQISDPLVHIIRNAVDHGIEEPDDRQRGGKGESGTIRLEAYHEGNYVVIEISDDGRGIDAAKIKTKALANGFADPEELEAMSDEELLTIIMRPGFSTADEVTHTSGRGVGMDVVKDNIEKLNGTIDIESTPGRGTLFRIKIPLTLAIIQALMVRVSGELFTIPLSAVDETIRIHANEISTIEGMEVYYLREATLPLVRLSRIFKLPEKNLTAQELFVVVVNTGNRQVGLIVDQLRGREEVVIKPLEDYLQEKSGFSGATILGDGTISLILDVADVVHLAIDQHMRKLRRAATM